MTKTLSSILEQISIRRDYTTTPPASTETIYSVRVALINSAAEEWAMGKLYKREALRTTTTLSTTASQNYVALPSDIAPDGLELPTNGIITVNNVDYILVRYDKVATLTTGSRYCYVYGNIAGGYRLYFSVTFDDTYSFDIAYFTTNLATNTSGTSQEKLVEATDITKCPYPMYLVFRTLATIVATEDNDTAKANDYTNQANTIAMMMDVSDALGQKNESAVMLTDDEELGYEPIGGLTP